MCLKNQRGMSLLEILLAISIGASLTVIATRYFISTTQSLRVTQTIDQVKHFVDGSYQWLQAQHQADFLGPDKQQKTTAISVAKLSQAGLIVDSQPKDVWGGDFTIGPATDPQYVEVAFDHLPAAACANLDAELHNFVKPGSPGCFDHHRYVGDF